MESKKADHFIPNTFAYSTFCPNAPPAATVESGDTVSFQTTDQSYLALSGLNKYSKDHSLKELEEISKNQKIENKDNAIPTFSLENINMVTGPVFVKGAEVGDRLRVKVLDIQITRCWSVWSNDKSVGGCLASKRALVDGCSSVRELVMEKTSDGKGMVRLSERMSVPLEPMIGCIATAPAVHTDHSFGCGCSTFEPTYPHGGNMDLREMETGTTIWLPVNNAGGLLFIGDVHACMARGEAAWVGYEASGVVTVQIDLEKIGHFAHSAPLPFPRLLTPSNDLIFTAVDKDSHTASTQNVLEQAFDYLTQQKGLTPEEAFGYCTAKTEARFGGPASCQTLLVVPPPEQFMHARL